MLDIKPKILIVDDDRTVCQSLKLLFSTKGFDVQYIINPLNVIEFIDTFKPDIVVLDLNFTLEASGDEGLQILQKVHAVFPTLPIILITAWGTLELAVKGMKSGAVDFITKPWDNAQMVSAVKTQLQLRLEAEQNTSSRLEGIIGVSDAITEVKALITKVAPTDATVLVTGGSGTGKELVAEAVHELSSRYEQPFLKVNLGGIPTELFESELFGHKKGAFTGAVADREGRFQKVGGGTLFLDEIGDLSAPSQVKLLRVLQERTFEPLGSSETLKSHARVVSATHRDLHKMVEEEKFREDLFYRINLLHIHLPDLNQRAEDIPYLTQAFVQKLNGGGSSKDIEDSALEWLSIQDFPGNVRQLKNWVERTWLLSDRRKLSIQDFKAQQNPTGRKTRAGQTLEQVEKEMIEKAISGKKGNMTEVAKSLGITRSALYRRITKYGISYED